MNKQLETIAHEILGLDTLRTQNNDDADFYELAVWSLKEALEAAFKAGQAQGGEEALTMARKGKK